MSGLYETSRLEINLNTFDPNRYVDARANRILLEGRVIAVREKEGCLESVSLISNDANCVFPSELLNMHGIKARILTYGITWHYLQLKFKKAYINFWSLGMFWDDIRKIFLNESSVVIEGEKFLKGGEQILKKHMMKLVQVEELSLLGYRV